MWSTILPRRWRRLTLPTLSQPRMARRLAVEWLEDRAVPALVNGDFTEGLEGLDGWSLSDPLQVTVDAQHRAVIRESEFVTEVDLYQEFDIVPGDSTLTFTLSGLTFDATFEEGALPDAFGVSLLDPDTSESLIPTATPDTESYYILDLVPGATPLVAPGVNVVPGAPGSVQISISLSGLVGSDARLNFRVIGGSVFEFDASVAVSSVATTPPNQAPTNITLSNNSVAENAPAATIGTLTVTDPDAGDTHTLTVSDSTRFEVVGTTLKLKSGVSLDHEAEPTVNLTLTATDAGGLSVTKPFTITVANVNEAPTALVLDNATVAENAAGAAIGTLTVTDPDAGDTHTFAVSDLRFEVAGTTLKLKAGESLNYETEPTVALTVTATDAGGLSITRPFTITVTNVNEAPTALVLDNATVAENAVGAAVGSLITTDPDVGDTHTYTLISGDGSADNASFTIVGNQLRTAVAFDFEARSSYTVRVRTTDQGGLFFENQFTITVTNVNEGPTANAGGPYTAPEGGSVPLTGSGSDPDAGDSLSYHWDLDNNGSFETAGQSVVFSAVGLDGPGSRTVTLRVTDAGGLSSLSPATITLTNVAPTAVNDSAATNEDQPVTIGVLSNDSDPAGALDPLRIDSVTNGAKGTTAIDTKGTPVTTDDEIVYTPNAGATGSDSFTYTISDGDGGTATATVTVQISNLVDVSGRVFDDKDNDGVFEPGDGDAGIGGVTVELFNQTSGSLLHSRTTAADGTYHFDVNLGAGTYRVVAAQPAGFLDGREIAGNLGGTVDNANDSNQISGISVGAPGTTADGADYLFAEIRPSQALGLVWSDFNNDGEVDFGEAVIAGATVELTGLDDRGNAVSRSVTTDTNGIYAFIDLRPSNATGYTIHELQPANYTDGVDSLGLVNGVAVGNDSVNDTFSAVVLPRPNSLAENYNFGERPPANGGVTPGLTATIGYWQNKNGQNLIKALNGGSTATQLGNWLAATFPNMYGADAGANNLTGKTNAQVAAFYKTLFARNSCNAAGGGPAKMDAQVMATAIAVYVTNQTLAGTTATAYGFTVSATGLGTRTFNVGNNGAAFGVANNSQVTVLDLLLAVNSRSHNGRLYDLDADGDATDALETSYRTKANVVFSGINEAGDI